jgi:site-specific DNA recombinase
VKQELSRVQICTHFREREELEAKGWKGNRWITKKGRERGGAPFTKASLQRLLTNRTYTGNVEFKGAVYEVEHEAIVDDDLWQRVQAMLRRNRMSGSPEVRNKYGALLKEIIFCVPCRTGMGHSYTKRNGKTYRYMCA